MIDLVLIAIIAVVAWCVSGEGAYAAGATLVGVILAGLLAMNFFEPLAGFLENNVSRAWAGKWDMIALVGLFVVFVTIFRVASDQLIRTYVQVHPLLHQVMSWGCGALTGYVTMAFLLAALHTAPLPRDYWGFFPPERELRSGPLSHFGPDYQWLGFTQYVTERPFARTLVINPMADRIETTRMFDGRNGWFWNIPPKETNDPGARYDVLPSFTIRYATRRERLSDPSASSGGAPAVETRPRRDRGSRGGSPGF